MSHSYMNHNGKGWVKAGQFTTAKVSETFTDKPDPIFGLRVGEHCQYSGAAVVREFNSILNAYGFERIAKDGVSEYVSRAYGMRYELELLPKKSRFVTRTA